MGLQPAAALGAFAGLVQAGAGEVGRLVHLLQRRGHPGHATQLAGLVGQHDVQHVVGGHAQQAHGGTGPFAHAVERGVVAAHVVGQHAAEGIDLDALSDLDAVAEVGLVGDGHYVGSQQLHLQAVRPQAGQEPQERFAIDGAVAQRQALQLPPGVAAGDVAHAAAAPCGPACFELVVDGGFQGAVSGAHA